MLKITVSLVPVRPVCIRANKNGFGMDDGGSVRDNKINDRMVNLSNFIKKISAKMGFLIPKASLAFISLKKAFTKSLILYYFDPKRHI